MVAGMPSRHVEFGHVHYPADGVASDPLTSRSHGVFRHAPPVAQIVMRQPPPLAAPITTA